MSELDISLDDEVEEDIEDIPENIYELFVDYSRAEQVGNEMQFLLTMSHYGTGLLADSHQYTAMKITGGTASGKTNMKMGVVDPLFPEPWLFKSKSMSDKALIDDPRWDKAKIAAMDEINKVSREALEYLKSSYGDDQGHDYTRNAVADDSVEGDVEVIESEPKPLIYLIADENDMTVDDELESRVMDIKVDEMEEINQLVGDTAFDGQNVSMRASDVEYNYNYPEAKQALQNHIANMGDDYRVILPRRHHHDRGVLDGYTGPEWDCWPVIKPIFNFKETPSKRHTHTVASLVRSSALYNHKHRETVVHDGEEYLVAEPQDVGNMIACRPTIISMTHNLDQKSRAVIKGISEVGGPSVNNGRWAPLKDIRDYLQESGAVSTISKTHLRNLLKDMDDNYLITRHAEEGSDGADMWEYLGEDTFGTPNIGEYPKAFADVTDPITGDHISETIASNKDELRIEVDGMQTSDAMNQDTDSDSGSEAESGTLSSFGDGGGGEATEYTDVDRDVAERLQDTLDDMRVESEEIDDLGVSHMIGASPTETYEIDGLGYIKAERPKKVRDIVDTPLSANHHVYGHQDIGEGQAVAHVENSVSKLRETGVLQMHPEDDGGVYVEVTDL
jgi:hypothetical protein